MSLLGIDVGTSGCKATVFSEDGRLLASAYEEYDYAHPQPGWAELDTQQVWEQVKRTIKVAVEGSKGDPVSALCVSALGEAVVPVTAGRQILGPSLLNFDPRGVEYLPGLRARLDDAHLYAINGNALGNHYSLTKMLWVKDHQPELYRQTRWFLHWSGFVSFMLGAEPAVDYSLANRTLMFDLERGDWSEELVGLFGFDRKKLPPTVKSGSVVGNVSRQAADELGLPAGIPIVSGAHDQCCTGVGSGVTEPGQAMYGMGTYICLMPVFAQRPEPGAMLAQGLNTEHHAVGRLEREAVAEGKHSAVQTDDQAQGQYVSFVYNQGGALVKWYRDTFAVEERKRAQGVDIYPALFAEMPEGPSRVMALPHFTATGPPEFIADSCGLLAGLHLDTPRGEVLKGLIESTTFYLRECLENLPGEIQVSGFRAAGGGSKSEAWLQVCADILGRPFVQPQVHEAGALGAAILAGTGCGVFSSVREGVETMVKARREFEPRPAMQRRYDERYAQYRQLWPLMKGYLRELSV